MSKSTIIDNPITSYKWIWDKNKDPLDFGFRKLSPTENEYTKIIHFGNIMVIQQFMLYLQLMKIIK